MRRFVSHNISLPGEKGHKPKSLTAPFLALRLFPAIRSLRHLQWNNWVNGSVVLRGPWSGLFCRPPSVRCRRFIPCQWVPVIGARMWQHNMYVYRYWFTSRICKTVARFVMTWKCTAFSDNWQPDAAVSHILTRRCGCTCKKGQWCFSNVRIDSDIYVRQ